MNQALNRNTTFVIIVVVTVAALARFYGLDLHSLWTDEFRSLRNASYESISGVIVSNQRDVHPPLFDLILYVVVRVFGNSEISLRFLSAFAGVLSVYFIYLVARALYTAREGVIAAALLSVSWFPVFLSQEARPYSLLILATLISFHLFHGILNQSNSTKEVGVLTWTLYLASSIFLCYLHYFGCLVVGIQVLYAIPRMSVDKRFLHRAVAGYATVLLAYGPWLPTLYQHLFHVRTWLPEPDSISYWELYKVLFYRSALLQVAAATLFLIAIARYAYLRSNDSRQISAQSWYTPIGLLFTWALVPIAVTYTVSFAIVPVWQERNLVIVFPAVYILLARAITYGIPFRPIAQSTAAVLIALIAHTLVFTIGYYTHPQRPQVREVAAYIAASEGRYPEAPILSCTYVGDVPLNYYFEKLKAKSRVSEQACGGNNEAIALKIVDDLRPEYFWLGSAHSQPTEIFLTALETGYERSVHQQFKRASVTLYHRR